MSRSSGAVRIIDFQAGRRCGSRETTLGWSKGYRYRGAWSARTSYGVLDVVTYLGSTYVGKAPSTGKVPGATTYWGVLALRGAAGPRGLVGPRGLPGAKGDQGDPGPAGVLGRVVVEVTADLPPSSGSLLDPQCPANTVPISGGAHLGTTFTGTGSATTAYIAESDVDDAGTGWASGAVTTAGAAPHSYFYAHVVCVSASQ